MYKKYKNDAMYKYLIILVIAAQAGLQGWRTLFNNFAVDNVGIDGFQLELYSLSGKFLVFFHYL